MNRRDFGKVIAGAALVQTKPLKIGMLLYPQLTSLT